MSVARRLPAPAWIALAAATLVDLPTRVKIGGGISVNGLFTLGLALMLGFLLPAGALLTRRSGPGVPPALWFFFGYAVLTVPLIGVTTDGVQSLAVYFLFIVSVAAIAQQSGPFSWVKLQTVCTVSSWLICAAYAVQFALKGPQSDAFFARRSFALTAIVLVSVVVSRRNRSGSARFLPLVFLVLLVLSGSRTATAVCALILLAAAAVNADRARALKVTVTGLLLVAAGYVLVTSVGAVQDRLFAGDQAYRVGSTSINTEGRAAFWEAVIKSAKTRIWTGHGAGTADELIRTTFVFIDQPHNDYLRILHDFGIFGLSLWALGTLSLLVGAIRRARRNPESRPAHLAAAYALGGVLLCSITDNVVGYTFVMLPLAAVIGVSLAAHQDSAEETATVSDRRSLSVSTGDA